MDMDFLTRRKIIKDLLHDTGIGKLAEGLGVNIALMDHDIIINADMAYGVFNPITLIQKQENWIYNSALGIGAFGLPYYRMVYSIDGSRFPLASFKEDSIETINTLLSKYSCNVFVPCFSTFSNFAEKSIIPQSFSGKKIDIYTATSELYKDNIFNNSFEPQIRCFIFSDDICSARSVFIKPDECHFADESDYEGYVPVFFNEEFLKTFGNV